MTMFVGLVLLRTTAKAQEPEHEGEIEGVVRDAETGEPLAGAFVAVVGTGTSAVTHGDGTFHLTGIARGNYTLRIERLGYRSLNTEVAAGDESPVVVVELTTSPIALQGMVVTATLTERGAAEALRPVGVMAGDALQLRSEGTVAATLASMPGMAAISMGPTVSQPVVRGLSGDRVLMLEDGTPVGDASNSGNDHATALDPSSARRIEVVRGPGALLYGGNALGGVINVIRDEIPSSVPHHVTGSTTLQSQSATGAVGGSTTVVFPMAERVPLRVEMAARTAWGPQDARGHPVQHRRPAMERRSGICLRSGLGTSRCVLPWVLERLRHTGRFRRGHEEGVRIEMHRFASKFQAVMEESTGFFRDIRVAATHTWYEHREIEPPDILGTLFQQQAVSGDILGRHAEWGPFAAGAVGARVSWEDFTYGGSLFTPDTRRLRAAMYLLEEVDLGPARIEWGLRYDWTRADPLAADRDSDIGEIRERSFHALSGSMGVLFNPVSGLTLGASVVRAFRSPDIDELYSEGPHLAAYAFEVGNPSLESEIGRGLDIFLRFESDRVRGEVTGFYNDIRGYVYGEDTDRLSRVLLPIYQFQGNDAVFSGFEAGLDVDIGAGFALEAVASSVQGSLKDTDQPLPLVPPLKGHTALKYERPLWFMRGEAEMAARQDRIGEFETPTDGYTVLTLSTGARITLGGRLNVLTVSLNNVTDTEYRNHLSRVKAIMPEAGRGLTATYRVVF